MKALLIIFSLLLVLLLAGLWVGSGSYPERWKTEERLNAQAEQNEQRQKEIETIKADLEDVASGDGAIEERARSELGMTKENESFYEIILRPESTKEPLKEDLVKGRDLSGSPKSSDSIASDKPNVELDEKVINSLEDELNNNKNKKPSSEKENADNG